MSLNTELNKNLLKKSVDFERGAYDPHKYNVPVNLMFIGPCIIVIVEE